jgi:hypothetical protein
VSAHWHAWWRLWRAQNGHFRVSEEHDEVEKRAYRGGPRVEARVVSMAGSMVRLRPAVAAGLALQQPPEIDSLARCWRVGLGRRPVIEGLNGVHAEQDDQVAV